MSLNSRKELPKAWSSALGLSRVACLVVASQSGEEQRKEMEKGIWGQFASSVPSIRRLVGSNENEAVTWKQNRPNHWVLQAQILPVTPGLPGASRPLSGPLPQTKNNCSYINKRRYIFNMPQKTTFLLGFRAVSKITGRSQKQVQPLGTFHHRQAIVTPGDI